MDGRLLRRIGPAIALVSSLTGSIVVGGLLGYGLDARLGTSPWLLLACTFAGFFAGVFNLLRGIQKLPDDRSDDPPP